MRIVHLGHWRSQWETENDWQVAFESLGHEVVAVDDSTTPWPDVHAAALGADLFLWSGGCAPSYTLDETSRTMWELADRRIPTATLHLDPWWGLERGGCPWWANPMFTTSVIFTASGDDQVKWERWGKRHIWLPPAVRHTAVDDPGNPRDEWICDVALVGSNGRGYHGDQWPYRRELHRHLVEMCARNGWTFRNPGGDQPRISREWMSDFYASATVTVGDSLCPLRRHSSYWSDRVPEATGRFGMLIMPVIEELDTMYGGHLPMYEWDDWAGLEAMVGHYLNADYDRNTTVTVCQSITRERHTYRHRAAAVLNHLGRPASLREGMAA